MYQVIVCHTYGVAIKDIARIAEKCKEKGWYLIEDICEALGNRTEEGKLVGYCFSLHSDLILENRNVDDRYSCFA